jgi:putative ABC transport system permease protein
MLGIRPGHLAFLHHRLADGRSFSAADEIRRRRVAIIRSGLARELGYFGDLLSMEVRIGDDFYRVVGVLDDSEFATPAQKALGLDQKSFEVYVPYETILERAGTLNVQRSSGSFEATDVELTQIIAEADDERQVLASARMIKRVLERFHEEPDYEIVVPLELLAQKQAAQRTFNLILILIASISLLVGGIGIANIMLATITERTREIGVRRALGAKRRAIVAQFLTETVAIAAIGGVIGVGLGIGLVLIVAPAAGWPAIVTVYSVILSFGISVAVGVLFGIFPAMRAARMDPIQALRYE